MHQIEKTQISDEMKVADLVLSNPYSMLMLEHFDIELPLHEKNIKEVCSEKNISLSVFLAFANLYNGSADSFADSFSLKDIHVIVNYLKKSHQFYSDEIYPKIINIIRQLNNENVLKEIEMVEKFFNEYFNEVEEHLNYENNIVFPYILNLHKLILEKSSLFNQNQYSVETYKDQHNDIEEKLDDLMNLLIKYLPKTIDPQIRRELLFSLFQLDHDLKIHSRIEDFILIPLVIKMEKQLNK